VSSSVEAGMVGRHKQAYEAIYQGAGDRRFDDLMSPWYQFVQGHLPELNGIRLLEVACGVGALACYSARLGAEVWAVDLAETAVQIGKSLAADTNTDPKFVCASIYELPFTSAFFDVIVSCETLEHLERPADGVRELRRVVRRGGQLLLTTPNYLNMVGLYRLGLALRGRPFQSGDKIQPVERFLTFCQVLWLLQGSGFRVLRMESRMHRLWVPKLGMRTLKAPDTSPTLRRWLRPFGLHFGFMAEAV
jgi:2-polyprenyl-3-methyl-5-hydroxy-6-metoxy-1,4-benzoquinol methylase